MVATEKIPGSGMFSLVLLAMLSQVVWLPLFLLQHTPWQASDALDGDKTESEDTDAQLAASLAKAEQEASGTGVAKPLVAGSDASTIPDPVTLPTPVEGLQSDPLLSGLPSHTRERHQPAAATPLVASASIAADRDYSALPVPRPRWDSASLRRPLSSDVIRPDSSTYGDPVTLPTATATPRSTTDPVVAEQPALSRPRWSAVDPSTVIESAQASLPKPAEPLAESQPPSHVAVSAPSQEMSKLAVSKVIDDHVAPVPTW